MSQREGFRGKGASDSYPIYLARMIVLYEENFNELIGDLKHIESYNKLNLLRKSPGFGKYNKEEEDGFPNASLNGFRNFLVNISNIEEQKFEITFDEKSLYIPIQKKLSLIKGPTKKIYKSMYSFEYVYDRNHNESQQAKINADWMCEYNKDHKTFISGINNKPYVESHHLIPMLAQIDFENTIDYADNIIALCPTCHRNIHYGTTEDKEKMLKFFFKKRKSLYPKYGISITMSNLKSYYRN